MGLHECGLPEEKLPQCWNDDIRMNALFAPFRLKTANPESWEMKMKFWSDMIRQWCRVKGDPIVSAADAKVAFQRKGRTPACIDIIVEEMYRNGDLVPITKYQQILHSGPEGWVRWGARLAFKPAAIALTAVTSLIPARQAIDNDGLPKASIEPTQRFVLESVLKEQATSLLADYPAGIERVGTTDELMKRAGWRQTREAFELALGWLLSVGAATIKGDIVKLAEPSKKVEEVTKSDEALVRLSLAEARLEADAARLARDVELAHRDALAQYALGNKPAAKNHLRRRHRASQRMAKCESALDNVRQLMQSVRDSHDSRAIVDTYKTTSEAMKETGLTEDSVHDTMDDLRDVMDSYNEVERALSGPVEDFDAAELEAELMDLLSTGKDKEATPSKPRKNTEREFVFDGEERILAELNELGIDDIPPPPTNNNNNKKVPVAEWDAATNDSTRPTKVSPGKGSLDGARSQPWYPTTAQCLRSDAWNNNVELCQDERLHPGQTLNIDYSSPPRLYNTDFQVQDHKLASRVWLYNPKDSTLAASTEYYSGESPGKAGGKFQMAPGGERGKATGKDSVGEHKRTVAEEVKDNVGSASGASAEDDAVADLVRRIHNLRGSFLAPGGEHERETAAKDSGEIQREHINVKDNVGSASGASTEDEAVADLVRRIYNLRGQSAPSERPRN